MSLISSDPKMRTGSYLVRTLGCKANLHDSQRIEAELQRRGWIPAPEAFAGVADLCIVNSCTVTDEADRQSRKLAARLSRDNPSARVVVTGCSAEVDPERLASSKGIHYVIGNRDKPALVELILKRLESETELAPSEQSAGEILGRASGYEEMRSRHPMDREWSLPDRAEWTASGSAVGAEMRQTRTTRAFIKIQDGCNSFCTYCVIPYGRGPSRSLRPGELVEQVRELVSAGVREVVLTGTNIGDYGSDLEASAPGGKPALVELLERIFAETRLERLRMSSLDPSEVLTPGLIELMEREPRFCPHFHVSLQSPHSRILRLMKRRYSYDEVKRCLERIAAIRPASNASGQEPVYVGMDVITGFPGESDTEFEWGLERLRELPWTRLHVFPYSERVGTPATRLPGAVPQSVRVERARKLQALSLERARHHAQSLCEAYQRQGFLISHILGEVYSSSGTFGYTPGYLRVRVKGLPGESLRNELFTARPVRVESDSASGEAWIEAELE